MKVTQIKELRRSLKKDGIELLNYIKDNMNDSDVWKIIILTDGEVATLSLSEDGEVVFCNGCVFMFKVAKINYHIQNLKQKG